MQQVCKRRELRASMKRAENEEEVGIGVMVCALVGIYWTPFFRTISSLSFSSKMEKLKANAYEAQRGLSSS